LIPPRKAFFQQRNRIAIQQTRQLLAQSPDFGFQPRGLRIRARSREAGNVGECVTKSPAPRSIPANRPRTRSASRHQFPPPTRLPPRSSASNSPHLAPLPSPATADATRAVPPSPRRPARAARPAVPAAPGPRPKAPDTATVPPTPWHPPRSAAAVPTPAPTPRFSAQPPAPSPAPAAPHREWQSPPPTAAPTATASLSRTATAARGFPIHRKTGAQSTRPMSTPPTPAAAPAPAPAPAAPGPASPRYRQSPPANVPVTPDSPPPSATAFSAPAPPPATGSPPLAARSPATTSASSPYP